MHIGVSEKCQKSDDFLTFLTFWVEGLFGTEPKNGAFCANLWQICAKSTKFTGFTALSGTEEGLKTTKFSKFVRNVRVPVARHPARCLALAQINSKFG